MEGLILHCGAEKATREDLKEIETPRGTDTWKPVSHWDCATMIGEEAEKRSYRIISEEYGLNHDGSKMFGVMKFHPDGHPDYTRALGIRNSHDRTLSLSIVAGVNVFVCDNLAFASTGEIPIMRRHTRGLDIGALIPQAFDKLEHKFIQLEKDIDRLKIEMITVDQARIITCISAEISIIRPSDVVPIIKSFQNPKHEEFREPSRWSLYNSFTETAKKYSPMKADKCYRGLAKVFGLNG